MVNFFKDEIRKILEDAHPVVQAEYESIKEAGDKAPEEIYAALKKVAERIGAGEKLK